jgi:hypothetical protein
MPVNPLVGTILPVLADVMGRVTWFPFLFSLWTDQLPWALSITLIYHFMVYLPLRQISGPSLPAAQTFPSMEDEPTSRQMYMLIMPLMAIGSSIAGVIVRRMLRVPFHYVPISHLVRSFWPIKSMLLSDSSLSLFIPHIGKHKDEKSNITPPISQRYTIYATVAFVLSVSGSLVAQEIYAWVHGGGSVLDWILAFLPLAASIIFQIPFLFFDPHETYALHGSGPKVRARSFLAAAKIVICTALVTAIPQIVAIYRRNMNIVILSGGLVIVGVLMIAVLLNVVLFGDAPEVYMGHTSPQNHTRQRESYEHGYGRV